MTYTVIYSTSDLKGIRYSFTSLDVDSAVAFCRVKFVCFPNLAIIENDDSDDDLAGRIVFFQGVQLTK